MISTTIVAYLALFLGASFAFVFAALLVGWFLRARAPTPVKQEIYECGEMTVGPSRIQFDLRFYVVALVFLIFDVEVAFLFPWAAVFGTSTRLMDAPAAQAEPMAAELAALGVVGSEASAELQAGLVSRDGRELALAAMADMSVFFGVLLVGFVYVWYRGDLDWVRAMGRSRPAGVGGRG